MQRKPDDFFRLKDPYEEILLADDFWQEFNGRGKGDIVNILYRPDALGSKEPPKKWIIRSKRFINVSFAKTVLSHLEFTECFFEDCLFIGSVISECRFNSCFFVDCNFYRAQIYNCYIDPRSFNKCLNREKYANIGVGLYHELLQNSRQQAQPDFTRYAHYQFLRWKRYLKRDEIKNSDAGRIGKLLKTAALFPSWLFEFTTGSGMRLRNLAATSFFILFSITGLNYFFSSTFGLMLGGDPVATLSESFYFSTIVVTSLGFGDITPSTNVGRIVVAFEAITGFLTFALLVSMAFRKISN